MHNKAAKIMAIASIIVLVFSATAMADESECDSKAINVTDGLGTTHMFDTQPEHVVAIGKGFTEMICQIDALDKLIITDKSAYTSSESIFDEYKRLCDEGKIKHTGSVYSWDSLRAEIVDAADNGRFDKENDAIFLTGGLSYTDKIYKDLYDLGFRHILRWETIKEYSDVVSAAESISKVTTGGIHEKVNQMKNKTTLITAQFDKHIDWKNKKAFYVTYSGNQFKVGDIGSIATAVLQAAHVDVVTIKNTGSSTYAPDGGITKIIEDYGLDTIIFADATTITNNADNYVALAKLAGGAKIYQMNSLWNNYSIDSMNGYWSIASTLYHDYDPDFFNGTIADEGDSTTVNIWAYAIAGFVVAGILIAITYYVSRE